jgi:hypothetical protein
MRKYFLIASVAAAVLALATSGFALEKVASRMTDQDLDAGWTASTSCSVRYFNTCTGWVWVWSGWNPLDQVGVCWDNCCPTAPPKDGTGTINAAAIYVWTGAPFGYGFTGLAKLYCDNDLDCCLDASELVGQQTYLPVSGWNTYLWGVKCGRKFITVYQHGPGVANPTSYATDHPAAGPTGPQACGFCYPANRVNHSFYYGTKNSPLCPGSPLNDGVCDAQFLALAGLTCNLVSVEESTWGQIKNLYR